MSPVVPFLTTLARLSLPARLNLFVIGVALVALSVRLWPQWRTNPDLSHGLFMPVVFLLLLHESRRAGTPRYLPPTFAVRTAFLVLLTGALATLIAAGLYAAAVDWSHALVNFVLTASLVLFLGATLMAFSASSVRLIGFNWNALAGVGLWMLCAPIPPGTYSRLTLTLQLWVTEGVLRSLHLLGVAAIRQGNIIKLAYTTVGVEEACSGVRSLISCLFAGIFFSATLVRRPWARATIIALSAPLALAMNFGRSLTLTLLSNAGIDIRGAWHDTTGFAVLGLTAGVLGGLAVVLERGPREEPAAPAPARLPLRGSRMQWTLAGAAAAGAVLIAVFVLNTRPTARPGAPAPDLLALLPASPAGWRVSTADLYEFSGTLQTPHLAQRRYSKSGPNGPIEITLYAAYWGAGQAPVSLVASHTPDACWPGAGWTPLRITDVRTDLATGGRILSAAEHRLFKAGDYPQHVWFWHLYDGRPIAYRDPYSPAELLRIAVRFGFRHRGDQLFVRVSSNRSWAEISHESVLADFFNGTQALGL